MSTQVIVVNGGSSSGKSGIALCLQAILPQPWLAFGVDTLIEAMPSAMRASDAGIEFAPDGSVIVGVEFRSLEAAWIEGVAGMARAGARVIVDEISVSGAMVLSPRTARSRGAIGSREWLCPRRTWCIRAWHMTWKWIRAYRVDGVCAANRRVCELTRAILSAHLAALSVCDGRRALPGVHRHPVAEIHSVQEPCHVSLSHCRVRRPGHAAGHPTSSTNRISSPTARRRTTTPTCGYSTRRARPRSTCR